MLDDEYQVMARIDLAEHEELPPEYHDLIASLSAKEGLPEEYHQLIETPERDVYRAIARIPSLLEPFRAFGRAVWERCGIAARKRELTILTVAREFDAEYEWHQHVRVALKEGFTPEEVRAVGTRDPAPFTEDERALMRYVREYVTQGMDDETFEAFVDAYDEPAVVGVSLLAGLYVTVALFGNTLELETEEPFVGWELSAL
jgi:alkylhydroperoxidase family enzyme